jgi:amidase
VLAYGYDFEQATKARVLPKHTPTLPGDVLGMAEARKTP